jgi:hypothetical protein
MRRVIIMKAFRKLGLAMINEVLVNIYPARVYDSPYLKSYYNSGIVELRDTTGRSMTMDFDGPVKWAK